MNEANKLQVNERVNQVIEWLLGSETRCFIVRNGSEMWKISERQVDKYIKLARDKISETLQEKNDVKYRLSWHVTMRHRLLRTALNDHEIDKALYILDSLAKLEGLFDPALQEKLKAETDFYKKLAAFPIETALKILNE